VDKKVQYILQKKISRLDFFVSFLGDAKKKKTKIIINKFFTPALKVGIYSRKYEHQLFHHPLGLGKMKK